MCVMSRNCPRLGLRGNSDWGESRTTHFILIRSKNERWGRGDPPQGTDIMICVVTLQFTGEVPDARRLNIGTCFGK